MKLLTLRVKTKMTNLLIDKTTMISVRRMKINLILCIILRLLSTIIMITGKI